MSQTWVHGVFRLSTCWYVKQGEWWAGKKLFMFLHSIHQISLLWWFSPSVCGRLLPAEVVQKKKKFQISSLSRLDSRVWHQTLVHCWPLVLLSSQSILLHGRLPGPHPLGSLQPPGDIFPLLPLLLLTFSSPGTRPLLSLGKLLSFPQPFTPVYHLLPF